MFECVLEKSKKWLTFLQFGDTMKYKITTEQLEKILKSLEKGNRIEIIPCKEDVRIIEIKRSEIFTGSKR